jgi:hypothetical protein
MFHKSVEKAWPRGSTKDLSLKMLIVLIAWRGLAWCLIPFEYPL